MLDDMLGKILLVAFSSGISFASAWGTVQYKVKNLKEQMSSDKKENAEAIQLIHNRITKGNDKREVLKDDLVGKVNDMAVKLAEIHIILTQSKK